MADFSGFFETYGSAEHVDSASQSLLVKYADVVPDDILNFWERHGFGSYGKGLVWLVNPVSLEDVLSEWRVVKLGGRAIPIVRTAFGDVIYWQKNGYKLLDVNSGAIFDAAITTEILFGYYLIDDLSKKSVLLEKEFKTARKKLGDLSSGEIYGYILPLSLGGDAKISNMGKMTLREHLALLAQVGD